MNGDRPGPRIIDLEILLEGGHRQSLSLPENSPVLAEFFEALAGPTRFIQLPIQQGRGALSFHSSKLVAVLSHPPVVLDPAQHRVRPLEEVQGQAAPGPFGEAAARAGTGLAGTDRTGTDRAGTDRAGTDRAGTDRAGTDRASTDGASAEQPRWLAIDDFLSPPEYRGLLAWALEHRRHFEPGTVGGERNEHRENQVILDFGYSAFANLLRSRLLTWFPILCRELGVPIFPLKDVESQLTAANDGQYYRLHDDSGDDSVAARELTCVYYFHREPKGFEGGELRLYDVLRSGGERSPASTFKDLEPMANRMVVFPSDTFHEVRTVRCPSRDFADSRFAVTHWLHRRGPGDADVPLVWGERRDDLGQIASAGPAQSGPAQSGPAQAGQD